MRMRFEPSYLCVVREGATKGSDVHLHFSCDFLYAFASLFISSGEKGASARRSVGNRDFFIFFTR